MSVPVPLLLLLLADQNAKLEQRNQSLEKSNKDLSQQLRQVKMESSAMKKDLQGTQEREKRAQQDTKRDIDRLKHGAQSSNELTRLEAKSDLAGVEVRELKRQLLEKGVLAPKREEPEEVVERPPVGTLELGEDIFTARLLLKLGFMKKVEEARRVRLEDLDSDDADEDDGLSKSTCDLSENAEENVSGIVIPEVDGDRGVKLVKYGWPVVCTVTFCTQIVVLSIMLLHGLDPSSGACFKEEPSIEAWWCLHVSKALAMGVAGTLMGKELMDIVNYWMVAELLTPNRMLEVTFTALMRVLMTTVIVGANIAIFMNVVNPADVWLNMTALGFIATLGEDVLNVAKRGFFGHNIAKAVTGINFQLNFLSEYPKWFDYVRSTTILISGGVIVIFASISFLTPDRMCPELPTPASR